MRKVFLVFGTENMLERFQEYSVEHDLFQDGQHILLAVSGGVDSMVLMDLFNRLREPRALTLLIAHLNHDLRGKQSDRDAVFVQEQAGKLELPFRVKKVDVQALAKEKKLCIEEAAREARFDFFEELLSELSVDRIALGHQADDQAETVLMNLIRGAGIRGLRGMVPRRDNVIHPLLFTTRNELILYAENRNIQYVTDTTNDDRKFLRNRIRCDVIPEMEKAFGRHVISAVQRSAASLREVEQYLSHQTEKAYQNTLVQESQQEIVLDIHKFLSYFTAVQKMMILKVLEDAFPDESRTTHLVERIVELARAKKSGRTVSVGKKFKVECSGMQLVFQKEKNITDCISVQLNDSVHWHLNNQEIRLEIHDKNVSDIQFDTNHMVEYFDLEKLKTPLILRSFRSGDRFKPLGMKGFKKLQDFFVDEKVPAFMRSRIPILLSGEQIVWITGFRMDDRFKVGPDTNKVVRAECVTSRPSNA